MSFDFYAKWRKGEFVYELKDDGYALRLVETFRSEHVAVTLFGENDITAVEARQDENWVCFRVTSDRGNVEFPAMGPSSRAIMLRLRKRAKTDAKIWESVSSSSL